MQYIYIYIYIEKKMKIKNYGFFFPGDEIFLLNVKNLFLGVFFVCKFLCFLKIMADHLYGRLDQNNVNRRGPLFDYYSHNEYFYITNTKKNGITHQSHHNFLFGYLHCKQSRNFHCPGRAKIDRFGEFSLTKDHDHEPNARDEGERVFRHELFNAVTSQSDRNDDIHERIGEFHPRALQGMPLRRMRSTMYRWDKNDIPPNVINLREYVEIISSDEWSHKRQYLGNSLSFTLVQENDVVSSAIIIDRDFFNTLTQSHVFLIDISSQTIPAGIGCVQLMSLLCLKNNHASII
ncbi:uncharacterized protein LOC127285190 [Leptopilina boulardi]|uniref:uncharacterized protein LOC127285190 n=1 Tax=Leptopilina boulardi TaxID=63433 RepID=UPI0021F622AE|nr:uncharacterized protein LOC127285190 [Leptopilina boulardi]